MAGPKGTVTDALEGAGQGDLDEQGNVISLQQLGLDLFHTLVIQGIEVQLLLCLPVACTGEGVGFDGLHPFCHVDGLQVLALIESLLGHGLHGAGNGDLADTSVLEGALAHGLHLLQVDGLQAGTQGEGVLAHLLQALREGHFHRLLAHRRIHPGAGGKILAQLGAAFPNGQLADLGAGHDLLRGQVAVAAQLDGGEVDLLEGVLAKGHVVAALELAAGTGSHKGVLAHQVYTVRQGHVAQLAAVLKGVVANFGQGFGEPTGFQAGAAAEGVAVDGGQAVAVVDGLQLLAALKGTGADVGQAGGQGDGGQVLAVLEGSVVQGGDAFGQGDRGDILVAPEGVAADGGDAVFADGGGDGDVLFVSGVGREPSGLIALEAVRVHPLLVGVRKLVSVQLDAVHDAGHLLAVQVVPQTFLLSVV